MSVQHVITLRIWLTNLGYCGDKYCVQFLPPKYQKPALAAAVHIPFRTLLQKSVFRGRLDKCQFIYDTIRKNYLPC